VHGHLICFAALAHAVTRSDAWRHRPPGRATTAFSSLAGEDQSLISYADNP
jgi:hypothetical protein